MGLCVVQSGVCMAQEWIAAQGPSQGVQEPQRSAAAPCCSSKRHARPHLPARPRAAADCGCPIHEATRRGLGAALLRKPKKLARLVNGIAKEVRAGG